MMTSSEERPDSECHDLIDDSISEIQENYQRGIPKIFLQEQRNISQEPRIVVKKLKEMNSEITITERRIPNMIL